MDKKKNFLILLCLHTLYAGRVFNPQKELEQIHTEAQRIRPLLLRYTHALPRSVDNANSRLLGILHFLYEMKVN